ncbi:MAG: T9SS type A sorting domain-containing protein [Vicingaceae bacterium]|nr:T9SS type A sorting domain-containing protein [Vicingaceae bacterium]
MKRNILTSIGLTAFFAIGIMSLNVFLDSNSTSVHAFSGGSPGGRSSSPADASNCTACHSGSLINGSTASSITSNIPVSGYVAGTTYTITGTISEVGINKFGFEITAEKDADNSKIGTMVITDATNTKIVGGSAVTHQSAGTTGTGSRTWSFDWTAPIAGTGDITFYGAFNSANGNGATSGDKIYSASIGVSEDFSTSIVEASNKNITTIFPNPVISSFEVVSGKDIDAVKVFSLEGKKMTTVIQNGSVFDATELSSGIYFVQMVVEGELITKKIIKE